MAGKPRAECRIVSEAVWARARADYLSGMTAPAVAARHGVGVGGLRGRIAREGWSKAAHAAENASRPEAVELSDAPLEPHGIAKGALARASAALMAGRPAEAEAIVRALADVQALAVHVAESEPIPLEVAAARSRSLARTLVEVSQELAQHMLEDGEVREEFARWAFAWREARFGPEAAARDRAYAERMGWAGWLYDAEGRLTEEPEDEEEG